MSCWETLADYGLRSLGIGERLLPRSDFTLCQQVVLIGSGMLWNIYFGTLALLSGFVLATGLALAKAAKHPLIRQPALWFIFVKHRNGVCTFELVHGPFDSIKQIAVVHTVHPMRNNFGIGLAGKHIALGLQLSTQLIVVFNDAVVHQGHAAGFVFELRQSTRA